MSMKEICCLCCRYIEGPGHAIRLGHSNDVGRCCDICYDQGPPSRDAPPSQWNWIFLAVQVARRIFGGW
jgi:hypothetical protein